MLAEGTDAPRAVVDSIALRLASLPPACAALARAIAVAGSGGTVAARLAGLDVHGAVEAAEALDAASILRRRRLRPPARAPGRLRGDPRGGARGLARRGRPPAGRRVSAARARRRAGHGRRARRRRLGRRTRCVPPPAPRGRAARPRSPPAFLRRAAEEELPRGELVPLLRELARALIATEGPIGFPVLREALALAADDERAEIALELGRALFTQGYFTDACAALEAAGADAELAAIAVLDLSLVRRFGGLDALTAGAGASAVGAWIEVARDPTADGAAHAEAALADPDLEPAGLAAGLVALMAAGRLEQADAIWSGVAETARAARALDTLRLAVTLRAIVRLRLGRIADTEADLRELIAWVGELERARSPSTGRRCRG